MRAETRARCSAVQGYVHSRGETETKWRELEVGRAHARLSSGHRIAEGKPALAINFESAIHPAIAHARLPCHDDGLTHVARQPDGVFHHAAERSHSAGAHRAVAFKRRFISRCPVPKRSPGQSAKLFLSGFRFGAVSWVVHLTQQWTNRTIAAASAKFLSFVCIYTAIPRPSPAVRVASDASCSRRADGSRPQKKPFRLSS